MIVLDASAAVELVLATRPGATVAGRLQGETVHAPAHFDVEVVGAIRRAVVRRLISDHEGLVAVADFRSMPVRRWPIKPLVARAYQLRSTHTVADGVYLALAEGLAARLITCDGRLAQSHGHNADIELVA
ncbi:type II toxin-antitoxin system VapC family toxin [Mycobacterium sp. 663a-19]|uniref:type II toxin-antitoxin system VapC family toxin n=1 Tax=Mycobacterium sp. 663a-19 TaxID=2986148 RepID=UPI002D1E995F|nr:type II toxin-antitoxin system VapC family toxin [Mycobacterium sp. 663a-19]MEB3982533.1 type II toxin-antitoxin system VapC family toxin [Mycobacterium sp. 663a-19]